MTYQQITVTVVVEEDDVESIKREFQQTLEFLAEDYNLRGEQVTAEDCEDPNDEDLIDNYEDAA